MARHYESRSPDFPVVSAFNTLFVGMPKLDDRTFIGAVPIAGGAKNCQKFWGRQVVSFFASLDNTVLVGKVVGKPSGTGDGFSL